MTMSIPVIRRVNNSNFYKSKRRHAVGSHSKLGYRNPMSMSLKRPEETTMPWGERGQIELPSGYTVAETWAALRKSWLGFQISHQKGNIDGAKKYAYQIRKLQAEMAIPETDFDGDLLNEETIKEIEMQMRMLDASYDTVRKNKVEEFNRQLAQEERIPDYEAIMHDAKQELPQAPLPREEIFVTYKESANACPVPIEPACEVMVMHDSPRKRAKSCPYVPPIETVMHDFKKEEKRKRDKARQLKSCFIKMK